MSNMYKSVSFHGCLNERTGYGVHASRLVEQLSKLIPVNVEGEGEVHISLLDVVTASQTTTRHPYPSILYTVWESTEYPAEFMDKIKLYDQLWVPSEWQRACSIAQGIPEEFVKVVPEGVDPDIFEPKSIADSEMPPLYFNFLHVGQWQPRKSTLEICQSFLKAFPDNQNVRLYLSADTLFPSDTLKSTEERLFANGITDPRIIPIHYESREDYIRRLQGSHIFVTCARSEGWNLPLIESMACGIPSIASDFGGSTEYAEDALLVRIRELRKPYGIYGNWNVPGQWAEPDYDHLVEVMQDAHDNYSNHKAKALITSTTIREKFSWKEAAKKAYDIIQEIPYCPVSSEVRSEVRTDELDAIRIQARSLGYDLTPLKVIFTVDCHPTSQAKMDTLTETIDQIKSFGYPVLITSHVPLPAPVIEKADFYIYDKCDILSPPSDMPVYYRTDGKGKTESIRSTIPCHAAAALANVRNAIDFCLGKYDWIYQMSSDTEIDLAEWLSKVHASDKSMICVKWENQENTVSGQITACRTELMDKIVPRLATWDEFVKFYGNSRFCSERGYYQSIMKEIGAENIEWLTMDVGNRFNQVDVDAWKDDLFQCHFVEGPFLNIVGISNREYDISYSNPIDGTTYGLTQKVGAWSRPTIKFYRDWTVEAKLNGEIKFHHHLNLEGQRVLIAFGSKALGDTIAWIPYIDEFRKKHNCHIICSSWWNGIMDYPEIEFLTPGSVVENIYAFYEIGCFDNQLDKHPKDWRLIPLQKVAADQLGIDYEPIRAKLKYTPYKPKGNGNPPKPYICFSEFSTMRNKFWNREGGWQAVIDYCNSLGYDCISISVEKSSLKNIISHNGQSVEQTLTDLSGASFYIGLNHGPLWLATALSVPSILISGVAEEWNNFPNPYRIQLDVCRPGCFNDPTLPFDRGFEWCPRKKDYACTREITEAMVIEQIDKIRKEKDNATEIRNIECSCEPEYKGNDGIRSSAETGDCRIDA